MTTCIEYCEVGDHIVNVAAESDAVDASDSAAFGPVPRHIIPNSNQLVAYIVHLVVSLAPYTPTPFINIICKL